MTQPISISYVLTMLLFVVVHLSLSRVIVMGCGGHRIPDVNVVVDMKIEGESAEVRPSSGHVLSNDLPLLKEGKYCNFDQISDFYAACSPGKYRPPRSSPNSCPISDTCPAPTSRSLPTTCPPPDICPYLCQSCPANTKTDQVAAALCECLDGYFRNNVREDNTCPSLLRPSNEQVCAGCTRKTFLI